MYNTTASTNVPIQQRSGPVESRGGALIAIVTTMHALSTVILVARFWIRLRIQHMRLAADDLTIILSWLVIVAQTVDAWLRRSSLLGQHEHEPRG